MAKKTETTLAKVDKNTLQSINPSEIDGYMAQLAKIDEFADVVLKSKSFSTLQKKEDVVSCLLLAFELGIPPMSALQLGTKLDSKAVLSVHKGVELGVTWMTAIENIHVIPTTNGMLTTVGVHLITAFLNNAGITFEYIRNNAPLYEYVDTNKILHREEDILLTPNRFRIITTKLTDEDLAIIKTKEEEGIISVARTGNIYTQGTIIEFTKAGKKYRFGYTMQDAKTADLLTKNNWKTSPGAMLEARVFAHAGRKLVANKLANVYVADEISDINILKEINQSSSILNNSEQVDFEEVNQDPS